MLLLLLQSLLLLLLLKRGDTGTLQTSGGSFTRPYRILNSGKRSLGV
jgi:hypothetical protein